MSAWSHAVTGVASDRSQGRGFAEIVQYFDLQALKGGDGKCTQRAVDTLGT